jgi:hypothetical protein
MKQDKYNSMPATMWHYNLASHVTDTNRHGASELYRRVPGYILCSRVPPWTCSYGMLVRRGTSPRLAEIKL